MSDSASRPVTVLSNCPQCDDDLVVLRVIPGRAGTEYWTLRCTGCGGIHLDIVRPSPRLVQLEHDPEKWEPVFRKDHAQTKGTPESDSTQTLDNLLSS